MFIIGFVISLIPIIALSAFYKLQIALIVSFVGILLGILIEYTTICEDIYEISKTLCISSLFSYFCFIPGKHEYHYSVSDHVTFWPFMFLVVIIFAIIVIHDRKTLIPLNEGITFIYTILLYYWFYHASLKWDNEDKIIIYLLMALPSAFTIINVFTYINLSNLIRFLLSLWNTIIITVFSISFITSMIFQTINKSSISAVSLFDYSGLFYQYILLGLSGIYLINNTILIIGFIPSRSNTINGNYINNVKKIYSDHLYRYSKSQINIKVAIVLLILTIILLFVLNTISIKNYNFIIWTIILTYSIVKKLFKIDRLTSKNF